MAGKRLTGPVKTAFDLDDQVPVRAVTLFKPFVENTREEIKSTIARDVIPQKNIDRVVGESSGLYRISRPTATRHGHGF